MNIDHVCIAVKNIDRAREKFSKLLGYVARTDKVVNTRQKVIVQFLSKPSSIDLKLIEPLDDDSPIREFVKRGGGLHHLGFRAESVPDTADRLLKSGGRQTAKPQPGEAFDEKLIAFFYLGFGLNIEVIDTDIRRSERASV